MGKIANAVPRTAVEGRYRGKRNSTLTKTYKRHLLTIMAGMGMFNIIYSKNSPSSTGGLLFTHHVTVNGVNSNTGGR